MNIYRYMLVVLICLFGLQKPTLVHAMETENLQILMPLPSRDFDPTEVAVPWRILKQSGVKIIFATPDGKKASCDPKMISGKGLGPAGPFLKARKDARLAYEELERSAEFNHPISWNEIEPDQFHGIVLTGGHAKGMREILESSRIQEVTAYFMRSLKPVAAICHGVIILARTKKSDGSSVIAGRKVTALLESQELTAWRLTKLFAGDYYRTYSETVELEVRRAIGSQGIFVRTLTPVLRDSPKHLARGIAVLDQNLLTARWPGDAYSFGYAFLDVLQRPIESQDQ